ncbi:hypothetical protein K502DRAFT_367727 [Neoconidiobolus thromboides FSU 785]|nr:hypothetical protein K502DRAFT_367727 [Neoconidiobolus thromboides FSU 785]
MLLSTGQSIQVVIAVIGLILNVIVGLVVSVGLKLKSMDLKLILIIAILDSYYYIHNIIRMILIGVEFLKVDIIQPNPSPHWWCPFDATIDMALYLTCIELVAILSFMRYLSICRKKNLSNSTWYSIAAVSFSTNFILSLIYIGNGYYKWSTTELVCITADNPDITNVGFVYYYYFWFSSYTVRSLVSLIVIAFSYFNMISVYYERLSPTGDIMMKTGIASNVESIQSHVSTQYLNNSMTYDFQSKQITKQKWLTVFKLISAILAYSVCLLPDIILSIIRLTPNGTKNAHITIEYLMTSNLLLSSYGLVNSLFVISSHDPSRKYLFFQLQCLYENVKACFGF